MNNMEYFETAYNVLSDIYIRSAYLDAAMSKVDISGAATKIIYGVLEKDVQLEYIVSEHVKQKPKASVLVLLKIGVYCLLYMDSLPDYAIVNGIVELAKKLGKSGVSGFVNAVLKNVAKKDFKFLSDGLENLSFTSAKPLWFVKRIVDEYGVDIAQKILNESPFELEHIRNNPKICSLNQVEKRLESEKTEFFETTVGGLSVRNCSSVKKMFSDGAITIQSPSSMLTVQIMKPYGEVLDLCAAPGGKSVYAAQINNSCNVTACDVNDLKVKQIKSYCKRMMVENLKTEVNDATKLNQNYVGKFDCVLVDAPCSCFGTFRKHPDVFLRHNESTIKQMAATQKKILSNAVQYLKNGGTLIYSTCTLFKEENFENVEFILKNSSLNPDEIDENLYKKVPCLKLSDNALTVLPFKEWDGFFIARFKK